jgi:hypothetical protein
MPQFAGTKQRVLEVFVQRLTQTHYSSSGRGIVYPFDANGFLDVKTLALEGSLEISRFRSPEAKIVDLNPSIRRRRFQRARRCWMMFGATSNHVASKGHRRLPLLRPLSSRGIISPLRRWLITLQMVTTLPLHLSCQHAVRFNQGNALIFKLPLRLLKDATRLLR